MIKKATHQGECQICGATQKLPGGILSKHGYTTKWGFFSGVCSGAEKLPFELSNSLIAGAVKAVEATIAEVEAEIAELENIDSVTNGKLVAWHNTFRGGGYTWEKVPVQDFDASHVYGTRIAYRASVVLKIKADKEVVRTIEAYDAAWNLSSIRHWVHFLNCKFAKHLRAVNSSRRDWVKWQQGRLENWSVKPLKEIDSRSEV